jgi:tetratricopeptide (TPR) repeat protein
MRKGLTAGFLLALLCICTTSHLYAQLSALPNGGNKKAAITERIGITDVTLTFNRPGVKGREGKIWGQLIPVGFADQGSGTKAAPWRAGSNENTTIEFSNDILIEGQPLPAGKYGFFIAYDPNQSTLIFSRNSTSWGSFSYDPKEDALRVTVKPVPMDHEVEWLKYEFFDEKENSATIALEWEKLSIPFTVQVDYVKTQLESFRRELRSDKGFTFNAFVQAAQFCATRNVDLEEGLTWANTAIDPNTGGQKNFVTLSTKAQILTALNHRDSADAIMKEALPLATVQETHTYARSLIAQKRYKEALEIFKLNYDKHPDEFMTNAGMARGLSANGDYKKALEYMKKAQVQAPDKPNKDNIARMIPMLQNGQDIN